jgi:phosphatidylserine/phosphatidylglycerophosphate/cardiolipin synthase-like enzyme
LKIISFTSVVVFLYLGQPVFAQQAPIRCYFNQPVNAVVSTGYNAIYLNNSFADTIASYINRAQQSLDICMYNYTAFANSQVAKIATAVNAAAQRGVAVRWIYNGTSATANVGLSLLSSSIPTFASPNYANYIMHNKFVVIDANNSDSSRAIVITGSANWSDNQCNADNNNLLIIQSKQIALAFYTEFNTMWGSTTLTPNSANAKFSSFKSAAAQNQFLVDGILVEVYFGPVNSLNTRIATAIQNANNDLFFGVYTFTDNGIAQQIKTAFNNGISVRGIIDEFSLPFNAYSILNPVLGNNMLINAGTTLYHDKTLVADAMLPASDPVVITGSHNWTNQANTSNDENMVIIHHPGIANQYYQSLCKNFTGLGGNACIAAPCSGQPIALESNLTGSSYQWQVDSGNGFTNLTATATHNGINSRLLTIAQPLTSWYGRKYRCVVNNSIFSQEQVLKFTSYWNGNNSTAWENTANWNCGLVPDAFTDVVINNGVKYFPAISSNTQCRSIRMAKGAAATINAGVALVISGF